MSSFGSDEDNCVHVELLKQEVPLYAVGRALKARPLLWLLTDLFFEALKDVHERRSEIA
jgi:hypothetical protein